GVRRPQKASSSLVAHALWRKASRRNSLMRLTLAEAAGAPSWELGQGEVARRWRRSESRAGGEPSRGARATLDGAARPPPLLPAQDPGGPNAAPRVAGRGLRPAGLRASAPPA